MTPHPSDYSWKGLAERNRAELVPRTKVGLTDPAVANRHLQWQLCCAGTETQGPAAPASRVPAAGTEVLGTGRGGLPGRPETRARVQ